MDKMNTDQIIREIEDFAKNSIQGFDSGHDWHHLNRVRNLALYLQKEESLGDRFLIEISALLHDVDDKKFRNDGNLEASTSISQQLHLHGVKEDIINEVIRINKYISFSSGAINEVRSPEFLIVQDADRLDAIGAIGIARAFSYGGFRNNAIYLPESERTADNSSTVGHFYDKLLKLKDLMNTPSGLRMAEERHIFLERFLDQFYKEWIAGS
jgi:uncharacterized protein